MSADTHPDGERAEAIRQYLTSVDAHQQLLALTAAAAFGFAFGASFAGKQAAKALNLRPWQSPPAWVGTVEWYLWASIAVVGLCVVGWILTDYRRRND